MLRAWLHRLRQSGVKFPCAIAGWNGRRRLEVFSAHGGIAGLSRCRGAGAVVAAWKPAWGSGRSAWVPAGQARRGGVFAAVELQL
jgi:hypothetical protein